eukprot:1135938-Prorocentrum_minimum.AAC.1
MAITEQSVDDITSRVSPFLSYGRSFSIGDSFSWGPYLVSQLAALAKLHHLAHVLHLAAHGAELRHQGGHLRLTVPRPLRNPAAPIGSYRVRRVSKALRGVEPSTLGHSRGA